MAFKPITNPRGAIIRGKNGKAELIWNAGCAPRMNEMLSKKQEIIDSEVLRLCAPMVPKRTGALERSGTLGTVIGSGDRLTMFTLIRVVIGVWTRIPMSEQ